MQAMKVWYDALTGKQVRYSVAIAKRLRALNHDVLLTTRRHPDTLPLAQFLNEKFTVVGRYNPESLLTRLKEGARRQLSFCKMFGQDPPNVAITHASADQCRVAFGLGVPIILTFDTPYADATYRLTMPLSKYIVVSKAIPRRTTQKYNVSGEIVSFEGVDEVAWIKGFKPTVDYDFGKPLIVMRQLEEKAVYTKDTVDMFSLAKKLTRYGKVVFLTRYQRKSTRNLIIPKQFVDSASLVSKADLFIGFGGTITREAALQGTPAIVIKLFPGQYVNDFLAKKGFPILRTDASGVIRSAVRLLGEKRSVKHLLDRLDNPIDIMADIVQKTAKAKAV
jgi:predicted glycosyltransferase